VSVTTRVSLQEFLSNPDIHYYDFHELHNGEIVEVPPPTIEHLNLQLRFENLLALLLSGRGLTVWREFYYTVASNSRRADVAVVLESRRQAHRDQVFRGGPDLVVEILSPSNTAQDLDLLRTECFQEGTRQFWVINPNLKTATVYQPSNIVALYDLDSPRIPLGDLARGAEFSLDAIFA
jgi:Uma2 family endonuclease